MRAININNRPTDRHLRGLDQSRFGDLCQKTATPFMILRTEKIRGQLHRLRRAIPRAEIFYAVKANNHQAIIQTLAEENGRFDISSAAELRQIIAAGGRADQVIHSNPIKSRIEFDTAVAAGVTTFVVDNPDELEKFARYEGRAGVLLRFKTEAGGSVVDLSYKFGAERADLPALLDRIREMKIPFRGFCFHVGSQCLEVSKYTAAIAEAGRLIALAEERGLKTEILDIGGGFPIEYTDGVPDIEIIGAAIMTALDRHINPQVRVICEPGRYISGEAATLIVSVIGKAVRNGRKWYYIDDGLYGSFSGRLFDQCSYQILTNRNTKWEKAVLAGPTCDSFDVIYRDCLMPPLDIGDILIFPTMGAYCSVSATEFNGLGSARIIAVDW